MNRGATRSPAHTLLAASLALHLSASVTGCSNPESSAGSAGAETRGAQKSTVTPAPTPAQQTGTSFDVTGVVLDRAGTPVPEAMVMQGGRSDTYILTDDAGRFRIMLRDNGVGTPAVVAAKIGYRAVGSHVLSAPDESVELRMHKVVGPDNVDYTYKDPGDGLNTDLEDCTHCHQPFVQQFLTSKHAQATRNPFVQDLYAGVNRALKSNEACADAGGHWKQGLKPGSTGLLMDKCYLSGGVLADLNTQCGGANQAACDDPARSEASKPDRFGACADCHAPGINGVAGGRNLHEAVGTAYEKGVHCDTCHKVADVDLSKPPGVGQRLVMGRPSEPGENSFSWEPVFYGPLIDVPNPVMRGSYQPKFKSAEFCAGCHEQNQSALLPGQKLDPDRWPEGLPVHSTFSEWKAGPYAKAGRHCQDCHMPPDPDTLNSVPLMTDKADESIIFGWERAGADNRMHTFQGPLDGAPRLIDQALKVSVTPRVTSGQVTAHVRVENVGAGHAVPTGEPMRSLLLLVKATSTPCGSLSPVGGMSIDDVGGALATGVVGEGVKVEGPNVMWSSVARWAKAGQRLRVVRPTGAFHDYDGVGAFAGSKRSASNKDMPLHAPVGEGEIMAVNGGALTLRDALSVAPGDIVYLGEPSPSSWVDGGPSRHLAGAPGHTFARVLVDAAGERQVPHYRAIDMVRDNRIGPGTHALTQHTFARGEACTKGTLRATVLYRPHPLRMARRHGWDARDYVIATAEVDW